MVYLTLRPATHCSVVLTLVKVGNNFGLAFAGKGEWVLAGVVVLNGFALESTAIGDIFNGDAKLLGGRFASAIDGAATVEEIDGPAFMFWVASSRRSNFPPMKGADLRNPTFVDAWSL